METRTQTTKANENETRGDRKERRTMTRMQERLGKWMIDGKVDLPAACERGEWHLASVVGALVAEGLNRADAEAFAAFAFTIVAGPAGSDGRLETDCVTDAQYDRLTTWQAKG